MNRHFKLKLFLLLIIFSVANSAEYSSRASNPRVNNEKPEKGSQAKRIHPHALKLILNGRKQEAIAYLKSTTDKEVNPEQTQMLIDLALDKPNAWKFDDKTWPWKRTLPDTSLKKEDPTNKLTIAFGGGAGYVPPHERMTCVKLSALLERSVYRRLSLSYPLFWPMLVRPSFSPQSITRHRIRCHTLV